MATSLDDLFTSLKNVVTNLGSSADTALRSLAFARGSLIARTQVPLTTVATIYTVPTGSQLTIRDIEICNNSGSGSTLTLYLIPSGNSAGSNNILFAALAIAANATTQWKGTQVLASGGMIACFSTTATLTIHIEGALS